MIRRIVTYNIDKDNARNILRKKTKKVTNFKDKEVVNCVQDLNDTLDNLIKHEGNKRGAIGLSANQIGISLAISAVTLGKKRYMLINPKVIKKKGKKRLFRIGCFSLYKYRAMVYYNDDVVISYFDPKGNKKTLALQGDRSCVVQHEMDHLVGDLLFESLDRKEKDLFVPREALYKNGKVPLKNHGRVFERNRKQGKNKVIPTPVFYSSLFNDYTNYIKYVNKEYKDKKMFINEIVKQTKKHGSIFEYGNGTSALSVYLSKRHYHVTSMQLNKDMLDLAARINKANKAKVKYVSSFPKKKFSTAFSIEVLETLSNSNLYNTIDKILKTSKKLVFVVPTIDIKANTLKGNEHLRNKKEWLKLLNKHYDLLNYKEIKNHSYLIFTITKKSSD